VSTESKDFSSRRGPRPRFTREEVLRTALHLVDAGGPGNLSMRQLADELGVAVMTLYGYVRDKEDLFEGVATLAFAEAPAEPPAINRPWHEEVRAACIELYGICLRHPNLLAIALTDSNPNPGLFVRRERILSALRNAGFPPETALEALGVLTSYTLGFAMAQRSALRCLPAAILDQPEDFPALGEAAANYGSHMTQGTFEYGLTLITRTLRADIAGE